MSVDILGPTNAPNTVTARPADTRTGFGALDSWFKDCTSALASDGTRVMSGWLNAVTAQFRNSIRGNGTTGAGAAIVSEDNSDGMLLASFKHLIQRGQPSFAIDSGVANAIVVSTDPVPAEYKAGMRIFVKVAANNSGATTINWNALGLKNVVRRDGAALLDSDLAAAGIAELVFDGVNFQAVAAFGKPPLKRNLTIYVNGAIGNDANDGTANVVGKALLTPQAAVNLAYTYSPSQFAITIQIAAGTYGPAITPQYAGPNLIINGASAASVLLDGGTTGPAVSVQGPNSMTVTNLTGQNNEAVSLSPIFLASSGATLNTSNTASNGSLGAVFQAFANGSVAPGNHTFKGNSNELFLANFGGSIQLPRSVGYNIANPISVTTATASVSANGSIGVGAPSSASFTNPGNVTGSKYLCTTNGVIDSHGNGVNYFPGSSAGTTNTGGQYV
jgi:hypothetical protein